MGTAGRKIGVAIASVGLALLAVGAFAGGASAQQIEGEGGTRLECPASTMTIPWDLATIDMDAVESAAGQVFSDGTLTVTLSSAAPIPGQALTFLTVGAIDFESSSPVDAVELQLWQDVDVYTFTSIDYSPAVTSDRLESPGGSHPQLGNAPIKGYVFCYEVEVVPNTTTTTIAPTSTVAPTTTEVPTTTTAVLPEQVTVTTVGVEVQPQVETAPQQIAFTGSETTALVVAGGVLLIVGLALVGVDRAGTIRSGRHNR